MIYLRLGNMVYSNMQSIKALSAFFYKKVTQEILMSGSLYHRFLRLMFMFRSNI